MTLLYSGLMLIYVRVEDDAKRRADALVERGLYPDFNTVMTVGLHNLLVAEEEAARTVHGGIPAPAEVPSSAKPASPMTSLKAELPPAIRWDGSMSVPKKLIVPLPADLFRADQTVPVERWVFGQQNRVLPAKINARLFVMLIAERASEVELFDAATEIAKRAGMAYDFLNALDKRFGHGKDDLLSTGFPEPESEKAISRYANHFVAYESTQGNLTGMLLQWKFAGVKRVKNKTYLLPTQACIDFAALPNPLLDHPVVEKPIAKLSPKEIAWAVEHIRKHVPVEASAFTSILTGLSDGHRTPDGIDEYVREHAKDKVDVSAAFVSTQRSGAVSRMADLNLIKRQRDGTKVEYEMTALGAEWLTTHNSNKSK